MAACGQTRVLEGRTACLQHRAMHALSTSGKVGDSINQRLHAACIWGRQKFRGCLAAAEGCASLTSGRLYMGRLGFRGRVAWQQQWAAPS